MTRGRLPKKALREACGRAAQRGVVREVTGVAGAAVDFILFVRHQVVFVRVKRSHSRIGIPKELSNLFSGEIAGLRMIPSTAVVARELWILLPWGTWQNFLIGDVSITEVTHEWGKPAGGQDPVISGIREVFTPESGFLCPYVSQTRG